MDGSAGVGTQRLAKLGFVTSRCFSSPEGGRNFPREKLTNLAGFVWTCVESDAAPIIIPADNDGGPSVRCFSAQDGEVVKLSKRLTNIIYNLTNLI